MAVVIYNQPENPPFNAYNNFIIEFGVDTGVPVKAEIGINSDQFLDNFTVYPDATGKFWFNFQKAIAAAINQNHFADEVLVDGDFIVIDESLFAEVEIEAVIYLDDLSNASTSIILNKPFLKSVQQYLRNTLRSTVNLLIHGATIDIAHVTMFDGYPFDFALHSNAARAITITNINTGQSFAFDAAKGVNRIFVSNGTGVGGFEAVLPLIYGTNELEISWTEGVDTVTTTLLLTKKEPECGVYLKWFNQSGSWSYWKFMGLNLKSISSKTMDRLNRDFDNLDQSDGNFFITGKEVEENQQLFTDLISVEELNLIEGVLRSPKVYLYRNEMHEAMEENDFFEVEVPNTTSTRSNKNILQRFNTRILFPKSYSQTL